MKYSREKIQQSIQLQDQNIPYTLIISSRARRMSLKIGEEKGLEVVVPKRFNLSKIPRFIHEKEDWVLKNLSKYALKRKRKAKNQLKDGSVIKIAGVPKTIRILPTRKKKSFVKEARALKYTSNTAFYDNEEIIVYLPQSLTVTPTKANQAGQIKKAEHLKKALEKHLRTKAKKIFQKRTTIIAEQMGLTFNRISIKAQKTRWGSCSRDKNLNFNWRLILADPEVMDSIIIHELAHLKYLNHGKRFYQLVERYCPKHKQLSKKLNNTNFPL